MSFPLENSRSKSEWSPQVLRKENASIDDVWHELFSYEFTKGYLWKILNGLKLFFPNVSTNNKTTSKIMNNSY
jgi:hypothetical protein